MKLIISLVLASSVLTGCVTAPLSFSNPKIQDAFLSCNAGASVAYSAKLKSDIQQKLVGASSIDASVEQALKGAFMNDTTMASTDREKAYTTYVGCLKSYGV